LIDWHDSDSARTRAKGDRASSIRKKPDHRIQRRAQLVIYGEDRNSDLTLLAPRRFSRATWFCQQFANPSRWRGGSRTFCGTPSEPCAKRPISSPRARSRPAPLDIGVLVMGDGVVICERAGMTATNQKAVRTASPICRSPSAAAPLEVHAAP